MSALTGAGALVGLALRRERLRLPVYILGLAALLAGMLAGEAAQSHQAIVEETEIFASTPALRIFGLPSGVSVGGTVLIRGYLVLALLAALMSASVVVRHTRQGEETGRAELVGAAALGRHAGLAAALVVALGADLVLAAALAAGGVATGQPVAGSLVAGLAVAAFGAVFAGVAAVAAQLSSTARGASGLAAAAMGAAVVVSGVGNMLGDVDASGQRVESAWAAWLSPMGWGQQMRPWGGDHLWPLALCAAALAALVAAAAAIEARRDVGRGILDEGRGRATAAPGLLSPFGLAWRLQRGALLGWAAGTAGFGLVFGAIIDEVADASPATAEWYQRMGGSESIIDAYRASMIQMAGMAVAVYGVQMLLRMRTEEADGPLEPLLATAIGRRRWMAGHVLSALVGAIVLLMAFAVAMAATAGAALGDVPGQMADLLPAALIQLPGVMVIGACVVALIALAPRAAAVISWSAVIVSLLLGPMFGAAALQLPRWTEEASPFSHIPKAPAVPVSVPVVIALVSVAAVLALTGAAAFRRRDLSLPA